MVESANAETPPNYPIDDREDRGSSIDDGKLPDVSKRDKRRAKEARKKAEEEAQKLSAANKRRALKNKKPADSLAQQDGKLDKGDAFVLPNAKKQAMKKSSKPGPSPLADEFSDSKVSRAIEAVREKREKMAEKWGDHWTSQSKSFVQLKRSRLFLRVATSIDGASNWISDRRLVLGHWEAIYRPHRSDPACLYTRAGIVLPGP